MSKTKAAKKETGLGNNEPQALFYKNPVPLQLEKHAEAGIGANGNFNFAKVTNSVPLNLQEFGEACRYYPIAFTGDAAANPVAVLGLEDRKNLFVNKMGEWKANTYIPAYVRRYPFALANKGSNELILCIDEGSENYVAKAKKGDVGFFADGKQSPLVSNAVNFCAQFYKDNVATTEFGKELLANNLLVDKQVNVTLKNGKKITLGGFRIIDDEKFENLNPELLAKWHKNGFLPLIYLQQLSNSNWAKLADLIDRN